MDFSGYAQALGAAQQLVPSYEQLRLNGLRAQQAEQQLRLGQQEIAANDLQAAQQKQFLTDLGALGASPTPQSFWRLAAKYPTLRGVSQAAEALGEQKRREVTSYSAQIHSALQANRPDLAKGLIQRHVDAAKAGGVQPDAEDVSLLAMLDSGDPKQVGAAKGAVYAMIAGMNPDTAAKNLNDSVEGQQDFTLSAGARRYRADGTLVAEAPFAPQYRSVGEGETLIEVGGAEGGGPTSGGTGSAVGSGVSRNVRNNNPGNIEDGPFARSQPGYVGSDGRFARFADASAGTAAQGALLNSYIDRGFNTVGKIISRWAPASDGNDTARYVQSVSRALGVKPGDVIGKDRIPELQRVIARVEGAPGSSSYGQPGAQASGGARVIAQGAPAARPARMTPEEVRAEGLDASTVYYRGKDGVPQAVSGQTKATTDAKPWPAAALDARVTNNSSLKNIDGIIALLNPRNQSAEARTVRAAIGPGTGALGDAFTQWNSPEGTDARARIGQIGGLIVKDTSGAAVSASEDQRLAKWVPMITDRPTVALAKLKNLRREIAQRNQTLDETYSAEQGYKPLSQSATAASGFRILRVRPK